MLVLTRETLLTQWNKERCFAGSSKAWLLQLYSGFILCSCWLEYHPSRGLPCPHILTVLSPILTPISDRTVWDSWVFQLSVSLQHKPFWWLCIGLKRTFFSNRVQSFFCHINMRYNALRKTPHDQLFGNMTNPSVIEFMQSSNVPSIWGFSHFRFSKMVHTCKFRLWKCHDLIIIFYNEIALENEMW